MGLIFEWDLVKAKSNFRKHKVTFEEGTTIFRDYNSITIVNPKSPVNEKRFVTIGKSLKNRVLVAVHTERSKKIRLISVRPASRKETHTPKALTQWEYILLCVPSNTYL